MSDSSSSDFDDICVEEAGVPDEMEPIRNELTGSVFGSVSESFVQK